MPVRRKRRIITNLDVRGVTPSVAVKADGSDIRYILDINMGDVIRLKDETFALVQNVRAIQYDESNKVRMWWKLLPPAALSNDPDRVYFDAFPISKQFEVIPWDAEEEEPTEPQKIVNTRMDTSALEEGDIIGNQYDTRMYKISRIVKLPSDLYQVTFHNWIVMADGIGRVSGSLIRKVYEAEREFMYYGKG